MRELSTWIGNDDLVSLFERCIVAPDVGFLAVWDVSANTRSYWDNAGAARLGYRPGQNAEEFAAAIPMSAADAVDPVARRYQGGPFASADFTADDARRGQG